MKAFFIHAIISNNYYEKKIPHIKKITLKPKILWGHMHPMPYAGTAYGRVHNISTFLKNFSIYKFCVFLFVLLYFG